MSFSKYLALFALTCAAHLSSYGALWTGVREEVGTTGDGTHIEGEAFVPLYPSAGRFLPFIYVRGAKYGRRYLTDVTAGSGLRYVMNPSCACGVNVTYGGILSRHDRWFNFVGVGTEFLTNCLDFHLNGRIPVGASTRRIAAPTVVDTFLDNSEVKLRTKLATFERARWSIDGELGYRICCGSTGFLRVFGGGQYCEQKLDVRGLYIGAEIYNRELGSGGGFQLKFGGYVANTFSNDVEGALYLSLRYVLGCNRKKRCHSICDRLSDPIVQRLHPCIGASGGKVITESVTTTQYPVEGIWVAYAGDNLQDQIDLASANGMIFVDGTFDLGDTTVSLPSNKVLAGGDAFLNSKGAVSGASVDWGAWGNFTNNPAVITGGSSITLDMATGTAVDTLSYIGIAPGSAASGLLATGAVTIRNVDIVAATNQAIGLLLTNGDGSVLENVSVENANRGILISSTDGATLSNITTIDNSVAGILITTPSSSSNISIDGWTSNGQNPLRIDTSYSNIFLNNVRFVSD